MKPVLIFSLLVVFGGTICYGQLPEVAPGELEIRINNQIVDAETFSRQLFCMNGADTLTVTYLPMDVVEAEDYVLFNVELWAQSNLGQPQLLGRIDKSEASKTPELRFRLAELQKSAILAPGTNAIRGSLQIRQILKVSGSRVLEVITMGDKGVFSLNMVPVCPPQK
ncbi:MAG: hypothetical protein SF052_04370 [Bacteroidia bacterium]|nr:hypothetical protein [Bacteroidia bacterium]